MQKKQKELVEKQIEESKTTIKLALESEAMDTQFEGSELLDDGRNRKRGGNKGNKPPKHGGRDAGGRRNNFP